LVSPKQSMKVYCITGNTFIICAFNASVL